MREVIVQTDWYAKTVLTLIAALLAGLTAKPHFASRSARTYREQYATVANDYPLPVRIEDVVAPR